MMLSTESRCKIKKIVTGIIEKHEGESSLKTTSKSDDTPVTQIDLEISAALKVWCDEELTNTTYYSEEEYTELKFPALVVDPIDGTKELVRGYPECAVSISYMHSASFSDTKSWGWIFNPYTGLDSYTEDLFIASRSHDKNYFLGLVSKTEWEKGDFEKIDFGKLVMSPRGSIANKLGLLAIGGCDFVYSKTPKHIWDIAAGTLLCHKRGFNLYTVEGICESLDSKIIKGPLVWCRAEDLEEMKCLLK